MKSFITAAAAFVSSATALQTFKAGPSGALEVSEEQVIEQMITASAELKKPLHKDVTKSGLGAVVETTVYDNLIEKIVTFKPGKWAHDPHEVTDYIKDMTKQHRQMKEKKALYGAQLKNEPIYTCANRAPGEQKPGQEFGDFLPVFAADLTPANPKGNWAGTCFDSIDLEYLPVNATQYQVKVTTTKPKSLLCSDYIMFGNTEHVHFEVFYGAFKGSHMITFNMPTASEQKDVAFSGVKAYGFCDGVVKGVESLIKTLSAFLGGLGPNPNKPIIGSHVPKYMEKANIEFLKDAIDYPMETRTIQKVDIDPTLIKSGDYFAVMRLDGLDQIIMYGTGSHSGHSVMALRMDGELYIVESQDAWYWPTHGLQKTKWADWLQNAENADFHVTWMPLNNETSAKFNETAAVKFFNETEGLPYGYHNFLFGWIDTPTDNWPPILAQHMIPILFSVLEKVMPSQVDIFFSQAMNKRLGTTGLKIPEQAAYAASKNMTMEDVMAMPELDGWIYTGEKPRDGRSWVCSAYVAALWKAAGLFDPYHINSTEFSPKDVYIMKFFDDKRVMPNDCIAADPGNVGFCQLRGKYRMTFPEFNMYAPYEKMFDKCGAPWPEYKRKAGC